MDLDTREGESRGRSVAGAGSGPRRTGASIAGADSGIRSTDREEILREVRSREHWYHRIDLGRGVVTPGSHDSVLALSLLDEVGLPADARGLRVLDIGARDGFFSFEMERRGADVVALDYAHPEAHGFGIARRLLGSSAEHVVCNVYDLRPEDLGRFDLVLFLGVVYHLRNPLAALDRIRSVCRTGSLLFAESQLVTARGLRKSRVPLWQFFPRDSLGGDGTNKWVPNVPGLISTLEEAQFSVEASLAKGRIPDRVVVRAAAVEDGFLEYHRALDESAGEIGAR